MDIVLLNMKRKLFDMLIYSGVWDLEKMILLLNFYSQKLLLVFFPTANISSLCRKYASSKEYYYLHLVFHTFTVKHLPRYGWMNFGSGKRFDVDNLSVDWLCTGTRIHKN